MLNITDGWAECMCQHDYHVGPCTEQVDDHACGCQDYDPSVVPTEFATDHAVEAVDGDLFGRTEAELRESTRRIRIERLRMAADSPVLTSSVPATCGACGIAVAADHRLCPWCQTPVER